MTHLSSRLWPALALALTAALPSPAAGQVVEYYHLDALGSVRVVSDQAGQVVERHDYLPFGEECASGPCAANPAGTNTFKFTGKERDQESGLDYFGARYSLARTGRFMGVDPGSKGDENLFDPQRWNRYTYVRNSPLRYVDPDGRELKLRIYHGSLPPAVAQRVASQIAVNVGARGGIKNLTYDLRPGAPDLLEIRTYEVGLRDGILLDIRDTREGFPVIGSTEVGHTWGEFSAVATSTVEKKARNEDELVQGLANIATHELAHAVLGSIIDTENDRSFLRGGGHGRPGWLFNPGLAYTPEERRRLQSHLNKPGEVHRPLSTVGW